MIFIWCFVFWFHCRSVSGSGFGSVSGSGWQACKLFLLNRCRHKRTCCLQQCLPLAAVSWQLPHARLRPAPISPLPLAGRSSSDSSPPFGWLSVIAVGPLLLCYLHRKLLLVANLLLLLLLYLLANLVSRSDMQIFMFVLLLSNISCLLFFMQIFVLVFLFSF